MQKKRVTIYLTPEMNKKMEQIRDDVGVPITNQLRRAWTKIYGGA